MGTVLQADPVQMNTGTGTVWLAIILMAVAGAGLSQSRRLQQCGATA